MTGTGITPARIAPRKAIGNSTRIGHQENNMLLAPDAETAQEIGEAARVCLQLRIGQATRVIGEGDLSPRPASISRLKKIGASVEEMIENSRIPLYGSSFTGEFDGPFGAEDIGQAAPPDGRMMRSFLLVDIPAGCKTVEIGYCRRVARPCRSRPWDGCGAGRRSGPFERRRR